MDDYAYFKRILDTIPADILEPKQIIQNDDTTKKHNIKKKIKLQSMEHKDIEQRPHVKENGKMIFSKFELASTNNPKIKHRKGKSKEKLLKELLEKQEQLKELEHKNKEKADELNEKSEWDKAIKRSQGIKIKDDVSLLSRSIQRQEGKKKASKKSWNERIEKEKEEQKQKQKQRHENIINSKVRHYQL